MTLWVELNATFSKALAIAAASEFEVDLATIIIDFVNERSGNDLQVASFVKSKAVKRQFHTYFNWEGANANQFFSLFGKEFSALLQV